MFAADVGMFAHAQIIQGLENAGVNAGRGATGSNHTFATDRRRLTARVRTVGGFPVADSWRRISARPAGTGPAALPHCTPVRLPVRGALLAGAAGLGLRVGLEGRDGRGSVCQS
jgi:hypothetical protein